MMSQMVAYLKINPDVLEKIKKGQASLLGVTELELKSILYAFSNRGDENKETYWQ